MSSSGRPSSLVVTGCVDWAIGVLFLSCRSYSAGVRNLLLW